MRWYVVLVLLLVACGSTYQPYPTAEDTELFQEPIVREEPLPVDLKEPVEAEKPITLPDEAGPLVCLKLKNMTTLTPENIGKNAALSLAVGTDDTKPGVYDLGYLLPSGLFRIARQGLKTPVALSIKLRGPGDIQSEPLDLTFECDNRTYHVSLPAMNRDTIFYLDHYSRLYWRDGQHDGTGTAMNWVRAIKPEHRVQ